MASLKSKMRGTLMSSHGARANTRNNLWLVYSYKIGMDISLASNREVIYWLTSLETNPKIQSFAFGFRASLKLDHCQKDFHSVEVIKVDFCDCSTELHCLSSGNGQITTASLLCRDERGEEQEIKYVQIHEDYLATKARVASRLLHISSFAAQLRDGIWTIESNQICNVIKVLRQGTIKHVLEQCASLDPMVTIGVCSRMILSGEIVLDLDEVSFGHNSRWRLS